MVRVEFEFRLTGAEGLTKLLDRVIRLGGGIMNRLGANGRLTGLPARRQPGAQRIYESEGYAPIANFNANPVATFFGEKRL